jgi:hypothetical protein
MILVLLTTVMLASCEGITIGPVDTTCPVNYNHGDGSGCGNHGH